MNLSLLSIFSWIIYGMWVTPIGFETLSPNDLLIANPCISFIKLKHTLIWKPNSLWTDWTTILITKSMYLSSTFKNSLFFSLNWRFMILWQINHFPILFINFGLKIKLLCLARMALLSPTLAQIIYYFCTNTLTNVDPLHVALTSGLL